MPEWVAVCLVITSLCVLLQFPADTKTALLGALLVLLVLADWYVNPRLWQFLIVPTMIIGGMMSLGETRVVGFTLTAVAILYLLRAVWSHKADPVQHDLAD